MPAGNAMSYTDKVVHIMDTYRLPLPSETMKSLRQIAHASNPSSHDRFAEEEAALLLARHLHAVVTAELRSGVELRAMSGTLHAWSRFAQQAMYRADLGLINKMLYTEEILPLIDHVEGQIRDAGSGDGSAATRSSPRADIASP